MTPGEAPPRHLSPLDAISVYVGIILGSGIFIAPAAVAGTTRSPLAAVSLWLAAAAVAACGACCYAECATRVPRNGGFFAFHREAFGPGVAFVGGWASIFVTYPASIAAIALVLARHLGEGAGIAGHDRLFGAVAILAAGGLCAGGLRTGPRAQVALTATKVAALAVLAVAALSAAPAPAAAASSPAVPSRDASWLGALLVLLWSYDGWSDLTLLTGEIRNPGRVLGRVVLVGSAILFATYALVQLAVLRALPGPLAAASSRPVSDAVTAALGPRAGGFVSFLIVAATFGSILGIVLAVSRLGSAMAREGALAGWFGASDPRFGTPVRATGAVVAASMVYLLSSGFRGILAMFTFSVWIFYGLTAVAVFVLRRRGVGDDGAWRAPGGPVAPLIVLATGAYLTFQIVSVEPGKALGGAAIIAAAVPVYLAVNRRKARLRESDSAGR